LLFLVVKTKMEMMLTLWTGMIILPKLQVETPMSTFPPDFILPLSNNPELVLPRSGLLLFLLEPVMILLVSMKPMPFL